MATLSLPNAVTRYADKGQFHTRKEAREDERAPLMSLIATSSRKKTKTCAQLSMQEKLNIAHQVIVSGATVKDVASEHRVKINSVNYILRLARRKPKALMDKVTRFHDARASDVELEEHIVAKVDAGVTIDNAAQI